MQLNPVDILFRNISPDRLAAAAKKVPVGVLRRISAARFREMVRWAAKHSPFYKREFAKRGIDARAIKIPADLGDFYTTPENIAACPTDFICRPPSIVFESSGTTGKNKQVYYSENEMRNTGISTAAGYFLMGLNRGDRVANAFDFSIWIPGMICHYGLMASGMFCLAFGKVDPMEVYRRIGQYNFNVIMGEPTWLIRLTEIAEREGRFPLKMLVGGAEEMPPNAIEWMEKVWAPAKVKMSYGSVELGGCLGFQPCDNHDKYHIDIIDYVSEVADADSEGYGELVFTTLSRRTMPLIRYRTRDIVKMYAEPCPCGFGFGCMSRIRGRTDEMVVAAGGNLYPKMFEDILKDVPGITHDWQVVFRLEGVREILETHVESQAPDAGAIDKQIREQIAKLYPDIARNLGLGIFEMRVVLERPGSLRTMRKLKHLVDNRYSSADGKS
jgi:phenylacetate-CoA ligase